jgi:ribosomal protein S12 methylthiotransferase
MNAAGNMREWSVAMASLGCVKNTEDAENILGRVLRAGFNVTPNPAEADIIIVNTCGFLESARDESFDMIRSMNRYREEGCLKRLVVAGCMADIDREIIEERTPFVDAFLSPFMLESTIDVIKGSPVIEKQTDRYPVPQCLPADQRFMLTPPSYAYLKIADGCNNGCSYCRIPQIRGTFRSKPVRDVLKEAESLGEAGVRELILISQDSTQYGTDLDEDVRFPVLVENLAEISSLFWIRLMYLHPARIDDRLLTAMMNHEAICKYLDIPLQHVNEKVLKLMGRPGNSDQYRRLMERIRTACPGMTLRSTFITGFPGESERAFKELESFVSEGWLDHIGIFTYSQEPGTSASKLPERISHECAVSRREKLMLIHQDQRIRENRKWMNATVTVLIDEPDPENPGYSLARMESQAPDVDSVVHVAGGLPSGTVLPVKIVGAEPYDFMAEPFPMTGDES